MTIIIFLLLLFLSLLVLVIIQSVIPPVIPNANLNHFSKMWPIPEGLNSRVLKTEDIPPLFVNSLIRN